MSVPISPTVAEINANIITQLEASLNQSIPLLPKAFNRALAKALAAVFVLLWKYGGFIFLQIFVKSATIEDVTIGGVTISPLKEWGRIIGIGDPNAAVQAQLTVDVTVETQTGSLASGQQLVNSSTGVTYLSIGTVDLNLPVVSLTVKASSDQSGGNGSGLIGNMVIGDTLSFANPVAEVARETIVTAIVIPGQEAEATELYRERIAERFARRPEGGAPTDYRIWGLEPNVGIARIYPYTGALSGEVDVFVEATTASDPDGIPTQGQLDAVAESIQLDDEGLASHRPVGAFVNVDPITRTGFDLVVVGISGVDNLADTQALLITELTAFMLTREPFISGLSLAPRTDGITKTSLIAVAQDVIAAGNGVFSTVNFSLELSAGNLFDYTLGQGEKAKASTVVFT